MEQNVTDCEGCASSLIYAKHPFVVPGGRFREFYYWDTYFVFKGLGLSDMFDTMKGMIENFLDLVNQYGFMPNGARIYYLNRSQPPLLAQMVDTYISLTNDTSILSTWLPTLDKEYKFWQTNRTVTFTVPGKSSNYLLQRYDVLNSQPRPEAYLPDVNTVEGGNFTGQQAADLYAAIASGAESGWDFSSRWVDTPKNQSTQIENLQQLRTNTIIPIDLNSIMYANQITLQKLHTLANNRDKAMYYRKEATRQHLAIWEIFWDDDKKVWRDWDLKLAKRREAFNAGVFWPFWSGAALSDPRAPIDSNTNATSCDNLLKPFDELEYILNTWPGGIPTTYYNTSMQWDLPNGWPPEQLIALVALDYTLSTIPSTPSCTSDSQTRLQTLRQRLAQTYITSSFCSWRITGGDLMSLPALQTNTTDTGGHMFEKFDVTKAKGGAGAGGEYEVQSGFGWTNGVALWVLNEFGDVLTTPQCDGAV
ncbi:hypothetical protein HDV00_000023 [Rhizophlyctis rosea]|nr:hypothetical protein HDV00_000023 [Rhizophlyctis rosea]